jgi:hypothetical protein
MTRQPVEAWPNVVNAQFLSDAHQPTFEDKLFPFFFFFSIFLFVTIRNTFFFFGDSKFCNAVRRVSEASNVSGRGV